MKKIVSILLILTVLVSLTPITFATSPNSSDSIIEPLEVAACTESYDGRHHFSVLGRAFVNDENGNAVIQNGTYYTCDYCNHKFVCTGFPHFGWGWAIGDYLEGSELRPVTSPQAYYFKTSTSVHHSDSSIMDGYRWNFD